MSEPVRAELDAIPAASWGNPQRDIRGRLRELSEQALADTGYPLENFIIPAGRHTYYGLKPDGTLEVL